MKLVHIRCCLVYVFALGLLVTDAVIAQDSAAGLNAGTQGSPELHWRLVGPFRGGRTRAATGVPGQPNVFYVGQGDGGVWKSDDYGRTWTPIFEDQPSQ